MVVKKGTHQPAIHDNTPIPIDPYNTVIRVLGSGGAGNNTIQHIMRKINNNFETIAVNTDAQNLLDIRADRKILIGKNITGGLGAGGDPMIGEKSAEESDDILATVIEGTDLLFLTCGLGGGTGTGSAPVIGTLARKQGILTVAIVSMPFSEEGIIRWENAQIGLDKLRKSVNTLIVLKNDRLIELYPDLPMTEAFRAGDEILINTLYGLSNLILKKGLINLDFADISMVLRDGHNAYFGLGESNSENRVEEAVRRALSHPMMTTEIAKAQSALIHVQGGPKMTLNEARQALKYLSKKLDPSARIIWGATIEKYLKQTVKVMLILSGIEVLKRTEERTSEQVEIEDLDEASEYKGEIEDRRTDSFQTIFDIKESILTPGMQVTQPKKAGKPLTQTTLVFYKIFEEEAIGDLTRLDRAIHFLRKNPENRRAILDAKQASKLLHASAQMFGFDEIAQLLASVEEILSCIQSRELKVTLKILDSVTLAIEMVVDLVENRCDGRGETGYIVDRLKELKEEQLESTSSNKTYHNLS